MTDLKRHSMFSAAPRRSRAPASSEADITLLDSAEAVGPYVAALDELAANATDSNPLFEAATLAAALTHLQVGSPATVALIWSQEDGKRVLIGAFPYQARRFYLGLPLCVWSIWMHIHSFLATPLVRAGFEHEAIRRFMGFADSSGAPLMRFPLFQSDGAFGQALADVLAERARPFAETGCHERAFLKSDLDGEAYLAAHMRKKKRKEYNRLWNRLAETGELKFETPGAELDLNRWLESFFELERSGWKGKRGTALAERPNERAFFEAMCREAQRAGKFHAAEIAVDGKPLAMLASFVAGGGAYSFKIAYDENFARYSPGALLMMKAIGAFHDDPRIGWVDSCAIPNHPMIDHIWAERRAMREVNVATAHVLSPVLIAYSSRMTRIAERGWALARTLYHRLRKEVERD
ncbi:MAG TPA: GNAT family N-acetyltransferase [Parvibaculum sp.]|jgi:hypothetical protein